MIKCRFTDESKKLMSKAIENNETYLRMFGFNLCLDRDNNISPGKPMFEGQEGYVPISESICQPPSQEVGTFYSHPSSDPTPALASIITTARTGHDLLCIGTSSKFDKVGPIYRKVTCFELKNKLNIDIQQMRKVMDNIASENISPLEQMKKGAKLFIKEKCTIEL